MQGDNRMTLVKRSQTPKAAVSLGTISVVAIVCLVAGAMLPSRILSIAVPVSRAATPTGDGNEQAFISENDAAMNRMMADMTVKPSGDVNRDFVDMMVPHHQGAIDMAKALLVHGDNEALRRIAQEIVITQQQEIVAMRLAIGEPAPPSAAPATTTSPATGDAPGGVSGMQMSHDTMKMK
jgi:Domain of unknown function (DUF305)